MTTSSAIAALGILLGAAGLAAIAGCWVKSYYERQRTRDPLVIRLVEAVALIRCEDVRVEFTTQRANGTARVTQMEFKTNIWRGHGMRPANHTGKEKLDKFMRDWATTGVAQVGDMFVPFHSFVSSCMIERKQYVRPYLYHAREEYIYHGDLYAQ